jgi:hypothetical protein
LIGEKNIGPTKEENGPSHRAADAAGGKEEEIHTR